jgi:hypothetical protein
MPSILNAHSIATAIRQCAISGVWVVSWWAVDNRTIHLVGLLLPAFAPEGLAEVAVMLEPELPVQAAIAN